MNKMCRRTILTSLFAAFALVFCVSGVSAQGGWRQWEIHMRDGTMITASPLAVNEKGQIAYSMGNVPLERSKISYIAAFGRDLPPAPEGEVKKDLVVMLDGTRTLGAVTFREVKFSEGTFLQNGKKKTLEKVAYIKFAQPKKKKST